MDVCLSVSVTRFHLYVQVLRFVRGAALHHIMEPDARLAFKNVLNALLLPFAVDYHL